MEYQQKSPIDPIKRLTESIWNEKESLRPLVRGFSPSVRDGVVTVYLSQPLNDVSRKRLTALTEGVNVEFKTIGAFHLTNVGAKLRRREGYSGRMAVIVRGSDAKHYALTCGHVLQGTPGASLPPDVLIAGEHHAAKFAVKTFFDFNAEGVNIADAALAELYPSAIAPHNHLPDGSDLPDEIVEPEEENEITHAIPQGKTGVIESTAATILVTVGASEVTLSDMIIARSKDDSQFVQQGDSGSLFVRTSDNRPMGILLGKAKSINGGPSNLAIICPLGRTLDELSKQEIAKEHYPGPYKLV